jgi:hypothetical protein
MSNRNVNPNTPLTDKEKQRLADVATLGIIGISALAFPPAAVVGGVLWARDVIKRPSK